MTAVDAGSEWDVMGPMSFVFVVGNCHGRHHTLQIARGAGAPLVSGRGTA